MSCISCIFRWVSLVAQRVKCLPTMWETQVRSLGQEDTLEKEMATHSSTLAWKIPWMGKPGRLQSMGSQRGGYSLAASLSLSFFATSTTWDAIKITLTYNFSTIRKTIINTWKDAQHHSLLEKCKSKLPWESTSHWSEWPSSKSLQTINDGEVVEKREWSCIVGGNVNWYSHYGRWYGDSLKNWE